MRPPKGRGWTPPHAPRGARGSPPPRGRCEYLVRSGVPRQEHGPREPNTPRVSSSGSSIGAILREHGRPREAPRDLSGRARRATQRGGRGSLGVLHTLRRPRVRHAVAASALAGEIGGPFWRDKDGPGGWSSWSSRSFISARSRTSSFQTSLAGGATACRASRATTPSSNSRPIGSARCFPLRPRAIAEPAPSPTGKRPRHLAGTRAVSAGKHATSRRFIGNDLELESS